MIGSNEILFTLYVFAFFLIAWLKANEGDRLSVFVRSFWNPLLIDQQLREERNYNRISTMIILIIMLIHSFFIYNTLRAYHLFDSWSVWILMPSIILLYFIGSAVRLTVLSGLSWVFDINALMREYSFQWLLINFLAALILFPITIFYSYAFDNWSMPLIRAGWVILLLGFGIRSIRLFLISQNKYHNGLMYNILYLCGLEILPLLLLITAISRQG